MRESGVYETLPLPLLDAHRKKEGTLSCREGEDYDSAGEKREALDRVGHNSTDSD